MKTRLSLHVAHACVSMVALVSAAAPAHAQTQTWDYKSYVRDRNSGLYNKEKFLTSTVTLEEKDGKATFRMITAGRGDPCISRSDLPAEVERGAETTTITVKPELTGCEPFRYIVKNDGSGGVRLHLRNERWVEDGFDHGLTRKQ